MGENAQGILLEVGAINSSITLMCLLQTCMQQLQIPISPAAKVSVISAA
jgi:hypothetical protein